MKIHQTLYVLICEGACNPDIGALDARVDYELHQYRVLLPSTIDRLRTLRYTTHVEVRTDEYRCVVCQTARRYGHTIRRIRPGSEPLDNGAEPV